MRHLTIFIFLLISFLIQAQSNIHTSKLETTLILKGEYDNLSEPIALPTEISSLLLDEINTDSMLNYLLALEQFETRNSGSDTISNTRGIGASRTWIYDKLESINIQNGSPAIVDYLEFDQMICGVDHHKNVLMVHPGVDPTAGVIIIEAHMDSRCENECDIDCIALGMEDNGSGIALVMELARVMTKRNYNRTIMFMLTTAEEQGLLGANAMATLCVDENIDIKAVLNNDVIGGIICGETASPPGCMGEGDIDSTQVRIFSNGTTLSKHKNLARYTKLQYQEEILPTATVPMQISIMSAEDRTGRGGDHIPFRENGFTSIRFTSANENGNAQINADYHDHQHSTRDILGLDTDGDGILDSLFVDFNYLKRNTVINGMAAGMIAISPDQPSIELESVGDQVQVTINSDEPYNTFRIGTRIDGNEFDSLITITGTNVALIDNPEDNGFFFITACVVNELGVESCFAEEQFLLINSIGDQDLLLPKRHVKLLPNRPNPFDEATTISWHVEKSISYQSAQIQVHTSAGQLVKEKDIDLNIGLNEWVFTHGWGTEGIYYYSLVIDGKPVETRSMIFAY